ncbi:MAG: hypothetical protein AAFN92_13225, partial [Bacteroidota bacterium]
SGREAVRMAAWLREPISTWKITDVPVTVTKDGTSLRLTRSDLAAEELVDDGFLAMYGFRPVGDKEEEPTQEEDYEVFEEYFFYRSLPTIIHNVPEFERLSEFARVLSLFRWMRAKGGRLVNPPEKPGETVTVPSSLFLTETGDLIFPNLATDRSRFAKARLKHLNNRPSAWDNQEIAEFEEEFIELYQVYDEGLDEEWSNQIKLAGGELQLETYCQAKLLKDPFAYFLDRDILTPAENEELVGYQQWYDSVLPVIKLLYREYLIVEGNNQEQCGE